MDAVKLGGVVATEEFYIMTLRSKRRLVSWPLTLKGYSNKKVYGVTLLSVQKLQKFSFKSLIFHFAFSMKLKSKIVYLSAKSKSYSIMLQHVNREPIDWLV